MTTKSTTTKKRGRPRKSTPKDTSVSTPKTSKKLTVKTKPEPISLELPRKPFAFEVLDLVSRQRTKSKKIEVLRKHEEHHLKVLFIWNFDDSIISLLPEGNVPYKPNENPLGTDHSSLRREQRSLYNFVKGGNDQLSTIRRETIFIQMLEGLHPKEADIVIAVKDGNLEDMYDIPFEVVEDAYPDIQWGGRS